MSTEPCEPVVYSTGDIVIRWFFGLALLDTLGELVERDEFEIETVRSRVQRTVSSGAPAPSRRAKWS